MDKSGWGDRAGFLLPGNVKVGLGYYFMNHDVDEPWDGHQTISRWLNWVTAYVEPYLFRRTYRELSVPVEAGGGSVRYRFNNADEGLPHMVQTTVIPLN